MKLASILLLTLLTAGCGYKSNNAVTPAVPTVSALTPDNTAAGSPAFTLTVTGTRFAGTAVVFFNGVAQPTTLGSGTQVTAMVPATAVANPGVMPVFVRVTTNSQYGPVTQNSSPIDFTVN